MSLTVFLIVLLAALLHASWNALLKGSGDTMLSMTAVVLGHLPLAVVALPFMVWPDAASLPYIVASAALHIGYQIFLLQSYRLGDLTQVYPLARGSAPLIVTLISVFVLGVALSRLELVAIGCIVIGIVSLCLVRRADGQRDAKTAAFALTTGCFIAGYSLVDGLGARAAGTAIGYYSCATILNSVIFCIIMTWWSPGILRRIPREAPGQLLIGGGASYLAYVMVVWCFTQAPIALVTALRETSIVFALLIGVIFMRERLNLAKVVSTALTLGGAVLLRLAR